MQILRMSLSIGKREDRWKWIFTPHGDYTVWNCAALEQLFRRSVSGSFAERMNFWLRGVTKHDLELFLTICWFIWLGRNDKVWNNVQFDAVKIAAKGFQYNLERLRMCTSLPPRTVLMEPSSFLRVVQV